MLPLLAKLKASSNLKIQMAIQIASSNVGGGNRGLAVDLNICRACIELGFRQKLLQFERL